MFLLQWHLVIAILEVEYAPDFEYTLSLQDVYDAWEGVCVTYCGVIEASEVFHKSLFPGFFLGNRE